MEDCAKQVRFNSVWGDALDAHSHSGESLVCWEVNSQGPYPGSGDV